MAADPKPAARIVDKDVLALARIRLGNSCAACGSPAGSVHHIIPRSQGGDDVMANLVLVCGSGTTGCHGALHGNPYYGGDSTWRNSGWVRERLNEHIERHRADTYGYWYAKRGIAL